MTEKSSARKTCQSLSNENERIVRGLQKLVKQFGLAYNLSEENKKCM
jgi:hypothetical protein